MVSDGAEADTNLSSLDGKTRALVVLAAAIAAGQDSELEQNCRSAVAASVPAVWVEELLLQSVLMVGWPRALTAVAAWRRFGAASPASGEDAAAYHRAEEWRARGEAVCRTVYGGNYDRLRSNVRALHPTLDAWMVTEGYGRTLGRPGLDLARRELCVVAQVAVQGAERQLHSHLKGALHAGASAAVVGAVLDAVRPMLGPREAELAISLWGRINS